ncbi:PREDICTED: uncharacterized protein LOC104599166 [Nelumbo nucifera]|uniref:Uncharacterized protein LOC104599166 n=1 Tax=Nelumbo nucifera TaxID=4432 RepID=A0A1U8A4W6_NELNU|nr:PREDICTED: uncharacterized protein LOC104599166 [Nelumbo nucifera]XP_010259881.1 PREDICTED: uncharacterized protein LOC104599166 [Nelumbo nucifera]
MDFFKVKKFRKAHKPDPEKDQEDRPVPPPEQLKNESGDDLTKSAKADAPADVEDDDDDDFITNEVKRRLKELRRNSFMVLIPEESCPEEEEEEEEETSSSEWREPEVENGCPQIRFDTVYDKYCERMLFFDRLSVQQLHEAGSQIPSNLSPRSTPRKLASTLRNLSFKKREPQDDSEHLQQKLEDPYQDLETAYVAQICLSWEALHCQYAQLNQKISSQPECPTSYTHAAQQFQQFQVLLQRYIENEPFDRGNRVEIYTRTRNSLPKLLQVPSIQVLDPKEFEEGSDLAVHASDLIRIIEESILTFRVFLKMDKKKSGGVLNLFGGQNQVASPLQEIKSSLEKKEMKLKELCKKKGLKKKSWPATIEETELFFSLIDVKVIMRVLRMVRISKEQLFWCEEKMNKLELSGGKLRRDGSPLLFPC